MNVFERVWYTNRDVCKLLLLEVISPDHHISFHTNCNKLKMVSIDIRIYSDLVSGCSS
jgi:hypothetical protein